MNDKEINSGSIIDVTQNIHANFENYNSNELALYIVNIAKLLFEKLFSVDENTLSLNKLFDSSMEGVQEKEYRDFNINLFDDTFNYYSDLAKYLNYELPNLCAPNIDKSIIREQIESNSSIYYLSILLDLLLVILTKYPDAHKDSIIKFDITIICELFKRKNKRLCSSHSFFYCCVNELKEKYKEDLPKKNNFREKVMIKWAKDAENTLNEVKKNLPKYIWANLLDYSDIFYKEQKKQFQNIKNDEDEKNYKNLKNKYKEIQNLLSLILNQQFDNKKDLEEWFKNNKVDSYLEAYAECLAKIKGINKNEKEAYKKHILEDCLFPKDIYDIDLRNEENIFIISSIKYRERINFSTEAFEGQSFYEQYKLIKNELNYLKEKCYKEEIMSIIEEDSFIKEFFSILKSKTVYKYLNSIITFPNEKEDDYTINIIELSEKIEEKLLVFDPNTEVYLGKQYNCFIKNYENNYVSFRKLIILKELGYKIPACTEPSMRIFINPRLHFSVEAIKDNEQRKTILKSALIVLLVHEIAHLLKFYPIGNKYPTTTPSTPKNKENGRCLISYLFKKKGLINKINLSQSLEINNSTNWDDLEILNSIFEDKDDTKNSNNNNKDNEQINNIIEPKAKEGELDLYCSDLKYFEGNNLKKKTEKTDYCRWS